MTDHQPPQSRKLVSQKIGKVDKRRRPRGLTKAIRIAIDAIVFDRCTRDQGCKKAGITERALYLALEKPEVARHWNSQVQVLRVGERASNIHALADVRNESGNAMAKVAAVKVLEQLDNEAEQRAPGGSISSPGLTIQIINAPAPLTIDAQPRITIDASPIPIARQPAFEALEPDTSPAYEREPEPKRLAPAGMIGIADRSPTPPRNRRRS